MKNNYLRTSIRVGLLSIAMAAFGGNVSAQDMDIENQSSKVNLQKLYVPEKSKETIFIDGSPDEIANKLVDVFTNEIKVLSR